MIALWLFLCAGGAGWIETGAGAEAASVEPDRYHRRADVSPAGAGRSGATLNADEMSASYWQAAAAAAVQRRRLGQTRAGTARNVVMFLGDGMSVPTLAAARTLLGQRNKATGEEAQLSFEAFPVTGLVKTYCLNAQIPDSACTATAYLCGAKVNQGVLGVAGSVARGDCAAAAEPGARLQSVAEWALEDGRDAGIVTTTRVTHASPAGAYAKSANRNWENDAQVRAAGHDPERCADIARQLVHAHPGNKFKVILGGGRREFLPTTTIDKEGTRGRRTDGRNLIEEWLESKSALGASHEYVWNREQLMSLSEDPPEYLLGLFEGSHMQYELEANKTTEPTLVELTEVAIRSLSRNERGFFLFVEGGRIDHAHHDNLAQLALDETIQMAAAVQRAAELLSEEDSLLVVTADHAHVMAFNGYSRRGNDILGPSGDLGDDGVPYMTLSYTNGPGHRPHVNGSRVDVTADLDMDATSWRTHAEVPLESETHGGDDVAVFARGPHQHLFAGLYEQSHLPHLMAHAACLGPPPRAPACSAAPPSPATRAPAHLLLALGLALAGSTLLRLLR